MMPMREAALRLLPDSKGIFLRCDRGGSLYVTNAPMRTDQDIDWSAADFAHRSDGKLVYLVPEKEWIGRFEHWLEARVERRRLTGAVENACFGEVCSEDFELWLDGIKRLEMKADADGYEKLVRQRAAVCLREKRGGGTLVSCALMVDLMHEGGKTDED